MVRSIYITILLILPIVCYSQDNILLLKSGNFQFSKDLELVNSNDTNYYFIFFSEIPSESEKMKLMDLGLEFLEYIPNRAFVVSIPKDFNISLLSDYEILGISHVKPYHKIDPKLQNDNFPSWSLINNRLFVKVLLYKNVNISVFNKYLLENGYKINE